jgi:hypothetical protein
VAVRARGKSVAGGPGAAIARGSRLSRGTVSRRRLRAVLCTLCDNPILAPEQPYPSPFGPICIFCLEDVVPEPDTEVPEADQ